MLLINHLKRIKFPKIPIRSLTTHQNEGSFLEPVDLAYATYEAKLLTEEKTHPLILIHGLFGSKANWNALCKVYQQKTNRKIIALDARNHGDSPHDLHHSYELLALDIKRFQDNLGIEKASLLGHSMGGRAVMLFALKYPNLVDKLIVADISPISTSSDISSMSFYMNTLKNLNIPSNIPLSRARLAADMQLNECGIDSKELRAFLLTNLIQKNDGSFDWRINIEALLMNLDNIKRFPYEKGSVFEGPTLFIGGGESDYIQKDDIPKIKEIFPNAQFEFIEGAGHWLHSQKPAEFLDISLKFLNDVNK